jgi:hypothetical protein
MKIITSFNWEKISQFTEENTVNVESPSIIIEPFEPIVQEIAEEIKISSPNFFKGVNKIKLDMGFGQYGSVSSDNPADINLNFERIKSEVSNKIQSPFDINNPEHKNILKEVIKETILHEKGHVEDALQAHESNPEAGLSGEKLFPGGEQAAETFVRSNM